MAADSPSIVGINQSTGDKYHVYFSDITKAHKIQIDDMYVMEFIYSPCDKDNTEVKGIQRVIKNLQNVLENVKKYSNINSAVDSLGGDSKASKLIKKVLSYSANDISTFIKKQLNNVRGSVFNAIQERVKKVLPFLFPGEEAEFIDKLNTGLNAVSCAFNKVIRKLKNTVGNLLMQLLDEYINGPLCLIENFLNRLLNQILDPIFSAINSILSTINKFLGEISKNLFNLLDFVTGILNFFKCDDDRSCPIIQELNLAGMSWKGGDTVPIAFNSSNNFTSGNGKGKSDSTQNAKVSNP